MKKTYIQYALIILAGLFSRTLSFGQEVTTFAGSTQGLLDGTGTNARFSNPRGIVIDSKNNIFVVSQDNHRIRKITPAGIVTTFVGSTGGFSDGSGTTAKFFYPYGLAVDKYDNLYVADEGNNRIRKVTPGGIVSTLAGSSSAGYEDGVGTVAKFDRPGGLKVGPDGNIYVADYNNHKIRKITPAGIVSTFAGSTRGIRDAIGAAAKFDYPTHLVISKDSVIYVSDESNSAIRKISSDGTVTTFASGILRPRGIVMDTKGNFYVAGIVSHVISKITPDGNVTILAGSGTSGAFDGTGIAAEFSYPSGLTIDSNDNLYMSDGGNHRIRKITTIPNNKPIISTHRPNQTHCEGFTNYIIDLTAVFEDEETSDTNLIYTVSGNTNIGVSIQNGLAIISSTLSWSGTETLVFEAEDEGGLSVTDTVLYTINPISTTVSDYTLIQGESYIFGTQTITQEGEYTEVFISSNGCDSTVVLTVTEGVSVGVFETIAQQTAIYPNPTNGKFTIDSPIEFDRIKIYNTAGTLVKNDIADLSNLSKGLYIIELQTNNLTIRKTLIKE